MRPKTLKTASITCLAVACAMALPSPALAEVPDSWVTQASSPIIVTHGVSIRRQAGGFYADASGVIKQGAYAVHACTLYVRVWRNNTLVANSARNCVYYPPIQATFYGQWTAPPGTRATAETFFDVRFRNSSGVVVTKRFYLPTRAWIIV
jgi:hypothetical protein